MKVFFLMQSDLRVDVQPWPLHTVMRVDGKWTAKVKWARNPRNERTPRHLRRWHGEFPSGVKVIFPDAERNSVPFSGGPNSALG